MQNSLIVSQKDELKIQERVAISWAMKILPAELWRILDSYDGSRQHECSNINSNQKQKIPVREIKWGVQTARKSKEKLWWTNSLPQDNEKKQEIY